MSALSIQILWSENEYLRRWSKEVFHSFKEINEVLKIGASKRISIDGCDPTGILITYGSIE